MHERSWHAGIVKIVPVASEVDADATKVVSFGFNVGDPIPRSEWQRRGIPAQ